MEAQAHVQAQSQLKAFTEADTDDHSDHAPPSTRLHQLALAESKMSVADQFDAVYAERKQHYAEIAASHPRTPMPTTFEEAQNIIFNHTQTDATTTCLACFKQAKADGLSMVQTCGEVCPIM